MTETTQAKILTLIDASNFIFRAYHAITHLSTSRGVPTNAVYGFTRMMIKTLRDLNPSHVVLAFDKESRQGRQQIDPTYKANREGPPPDLVPQFNLIRRVVEVLNLPVLEAQGWEADDVIGTLAAEAKRQGFSVLVVTGDKDFIQIVDEDVRLFDPMQDRYTGPDDVKARLGIRADQMRDYLALVGDAIDNVAKVPGIGPKTAVDLLQQFGNVETLLQRLDEVAKPKIRESIRANQETLLRAKQLVSFKTDLPLNMELASFERRPIHDREARDLFSELEFFKLLAEMPAAEPTPLAEKTDILWDEAALRTFVEEAAIAKSLSLAPAFEGPAAKAELVGLGMALPSGRMVYLPLVQRSLSADRPMPLQTAVEILRPLLADPSVKKAGHDLKCLQILLSSLDIELRGAESDVELLSYLLNPSRKEHSLTDLSRERLRLELPPLPLSALGKKGGAPLAEMSAHELSLTYGACAEASRRLAEDLWPELERMNLTKLAREVELPLQGVLARMERAGVKVDLQVLARLSRSVDESCQKQMNEIFAQVGHPFNINSNSQLAEVLYSQLKLPVLKRGKTGPSTDQEVLDKLAQLHPLPKAITEYRVLSKLKNTYLDTLPTLLAADGRIHTSFNQVGVATGRLSSSDPNLQNIPIRNELGREIRRAFVAEPGNLLVSADYSQIELRILAHVSDDPALLDAFTKDEDIHTRTAAEVFGVPPEQVTSQQRRAAKAVNFGIAYGLSPHGLSTRLDIPNEEAKSIIDRYFERYAGIRRYLDTTVEKARREGFVETLFGRRRYMQEILSRNRVAAQAAERAAINMPIQGTAADLLKMAMIQIDETLRTSGMKAKMLLQVHDELLFEAPAEEAEEISQLARRCMSQATQLKVPLRVDVGVGPSWSDAH
jgi:DNA polymerase-1